MRRLLLAPVGIVLLVLALGCSNPAGESSSAAPAMNGQDVQNLYPLPDVVVHDLDDHPYRLATSPSTPVVVLMLGYTRCQTDCSTLLTALSVAVAELSAGERERVTVLHLTMDPEHDTDARQRSYLAGYSLPVTGLCADEPTTLKVAHKMGVTLKYGTDDTLPKRTSIQASAFVDGRAAVRWTPTTSASDIAADLHTLTR